MIPLDQEAQHTINTIIGKRLRLRRKLMGMSNARLANAACLSAAQMRRYEAGLNNIRMPRLQQLAAILDVPVGYFYMEH